MGEKQQIPKTTQYFYEVNKYTGECTNRVFSIFGKIYLDTQAAKRLYIAPVYPRKVPKDIYSFPQQLNIREPQNQIIVKM